MRRRKHFRHLHISIRWKIMACVVAAFLMLGLFFAIMTSLNQRSLDRISGSYETNAELNKISTNLAACEKALEDYMRYRSFEGIDSYYHYQSLSDLALASLQTVPSKDEVHQKEFIVFQMSASFFVYSKAAVSAQRANKTDEAKASYERSLACYAMLQKQIEKLNMLLLRRNAEAYRTGKDNYKSLMRTGIAAILVFFALMLSLVAVLLGSLTKPLSDISRVAMRVAGMDFDVPLFNSRDEGEIGNICRAFDRMIVSIREYIDKIWEKAAQENELKEKELEMRELYAGAQLRALQNQINPHFLFNTLNTGAQLAMMEGADKTCYFMEQVADFFRYNIQQKGQAASIEEELALVDNFVYIMKVRFGDRLEFIKDIPPEGHYPQLLPRMTLQPLVENCIKYGLQEGRGRVELSIEGDIYITTIRVSDNGVGFPPALRDSLLAGEDSAALLAGENRTPGTTGGTGTGLSNVISRLRLYFHRNDVFDILPNGEKGTIFVLRIPNV